MTDAPAKTPSNPDSIHPDSPFQRFIGFRRTAQEEGVIRLELTMRPELENPLGIPHGGVHAAMLDSAMGWAGTWAGDDTPVRKSVTLNLNVSYLATPANTGEATLLIAEGRKVGGGRKVFFSEGELRDQTGRLLARGSATFRYLD